MARSRFTHPTPRFHVLLAIVLLSVLSQARAQKYSILYSFGTDGELPRAGLVRDAQGNLYGTSEDGGANLAGSVFKYGTAGKLTLVYSFTGGTDGGYPQAPLLLDSAGNLYGTTPYGGSGSCAGGLECGVVFKVAPTGVETVLHSFSGPDGDWPFTGLIRDDAGNLYGTTEYGGAYGAGTIFKIDRTGSETVLYSFGGNPSDGGTVFGSLVRDPAGNLYGTTSSGGAPPCNCGTAFELTSAGTLITLHDFEGSDGEEPLAGLARDSRGNLYGTTFYGGANGFGTVFKIDTMGVETVLYNFTGGTDGGFPRANLLIHKGALYGTTQEGGGSYGTAFKLSLSGIETVLHAFSYSPDGQVPYGGLIPDPEGNLYGTTEFGGQLGGGAIFEIKP